MIKQLNTQQVTRVTSTPRDTFAVICQLITQLINSTRIDLGNIHPRVKEESKQTDWCDADLCYIYKLPINTTPRVAIALACEQRSCN